MISTNTSDISFNNQLSQSKCRQLRHRKRSNKSICSSTPSTPLSSSSSSVTSSSMSSCNEQTVNNGRNDSRRQCSDSDSRQTSQSVRTQKLEKVRNSAKNVDNRTCGHSTRLSRYLKSIKSWTNYRPMCYLIELIGRCERSWIKSTKATGGKSANMLEHNQHIPMHCNRISI